MSAKENGSDRLLPIVLLTIVIVLLLMMAYLVAPFFRVEPRLVHRFSMDELDGMEFSSPVEEGAVMGAHWFGRVQRTDGSFVYMFDPDNDTVIDDYPYSLARHSASVYVLVMAYRHTGDERYLDVAYDAMDFVRRNMDNTDDGRRVYEMGQSSLFDNALTLIGFCHLHNATGDRVLAREIDAMSRYIISTMDERGRFDYYSSLWDPNGFEESVMASSEALLALGLSYRELGDPETLLAFEKGMDRYAGPFASGDMGGMRTDIYSWMTSALSLGFSITGNDTYRTTAYRMSDWLIERYYQTYFVGGRPDPSSLSEDDRKLLGSFRTFPSMNSCTYCEGLTDVALMAKEHGDTEELSRFGGVLRNASSFILNLQYGPEEGAAFDSPDLVVGGVRHDLFDKVDREVGYQSRWIRIDYTQHAIGALFRMLLLFEDGSQEDAGA